RLALDLTGVVVDELRGDEQRRGVRHVFVFALVDRRLDLVEAWVGKGQRHRAGEILDRRQLVEHLFETAHRLRPGSTTACGGGRTPTRRTDQPLERVGLHVEQAGDLERFTQFGE